VITIYVSQVVVAALVSDYDEVCVRAGGGDQLNQCGNTTTINYRN
jgi:hypothetical protein